VYIQLRMKGKVPFHIVLAQVLHDVCSTAAARTIIAVKRPLPHPRHTKFTKNSFHRTLIGRRISDALISCRTNFYP